MKGAARERGVMPVKKKLAGKREKKAFEGHGQRVGASHRMRCASSATSGICIGSC
jgi:hypothetical protein